MMGGLFITRHWVRASVLLDRDQGRSLWGSRTDLHLGPGAWILTASRARGRPAEMVGCSQNAMRVPGPRTPANTMTCPSPLGITT